MYGLEEAFNFAAALGFVRFGVDQGDTQRSSDLLEMRGTEGRTVIHVGLSGQSSFEQSLSH
ncbi:hypothetical protein DSTSK_36510 [Desulforhabdus sp. TSK]|nr:hypothetical protein DSTSK_36510 [Desulforhabdus sp. TSK]